MIDKLQDEDIVFIFIFICLTTIYVFTFLLEKDIKLREAVIIVFSNAITAYASRKGNK